MHLIFLPLLVVATVAAEVTCRWEVVELGMTTCHNTHRISKTAVDLDACKSACENNDDCLYIFWQSAAELGKADPKCNIFRECSSYRSITSTGTTYELSCGVLPVVDMHTVLQNALDTTGCTSGIYDLDEPTYTRDWENLHEAGDVQQLFEDLFDTCYSTMRGTATPKQEEQCCGEAAITVHEKSVEMAASGGVIIETCGPKASMIPFTGTMVSSNPPQCKQMYNYPCEAFDYRERVTRALHATGCPNPNPDFDLIDSWESFTDEKIWGRLQDYCEVVQKNIGSASTQAKGKAFCCGEEDCMPSHCTTQTSWDCGEPSCPVMKDTAISANGLATYIGETLKSCQELCQITSKCMSWSFYETSTMCSLYKDTVSTSIRVPFTGRHSGYKCAKTYKCMQGQGASSQSYAKYALSTEAECAAKCFEESAGAGKLGTSVKQPYTCVSGQGGKGKSTQSENLNNKHLCAEKCNKKSGCIGFDFTENSQGDSCRIYLTTDSQRVGDEGSDDRLWCTRVTQPCVGFDFTETGSHSQCRLYRTVNNARLGNPGNDDRLWCPEHTGGFLPEVEYECMPQTMADGTQYYKGDETPLECSRRCALDHKCVGFDFTANANAMPCRLFFWDQDSTQIQPTNDRRFCRRLTFSERANNLCDGIPEDPCVDRDECRWVDGQCTLEDTIWCRNGRISDNKSLWDDWYMKYDVDDARDCWEKCLDSPNCFAYEYESNGDRTCYLHDAWNTIGTYNRYVYDPGCDSSDDGIFCSDEVEDDEGWKYCRRISSYDIDYYYSTSQQWWAPARP